MSHSTTNPYETNYQAEYYDLSMVPKITGDGPVYWDALRNMRDRRQGSICRVLDIGTGTGRVIRGLAVSLKQSGEDPANIEFIGLDLEQAMVDRAAAMPIESLSNDQVFWIQGSAVDLDAAVPASHRPIDLLIFSFSSISHLHEPGQVGRFFREVAKVLRPRTGRAMVSIHDDTLLNNPNPQVILIQTDKPSETPSKAFPNVVYQMVDTGCDVDGNVHTYKWTVTVVERSNGQERVLETSNSEMKVRMWEAEELPAIATGQGLQNVDRIRNEHETVYVFAVDE
ncbi:hypothetical protein PHISCL_04480 [Aspergillus sclerotialis]|uniref:Methyltransferase domain-containing protein n=1 Tax=Aspergillus sclerotialis TaxID=2070753 RepID=A0A3A2ZLK1_9EURO|nr:hypothetical protein PHISCL_04480 [Aspergillus sclerotialis]